MVVIISSSEKEISVPPSGDGAIVSIFPNESETTILKTNGLATCSSVLIYGVFPEGRQKAIMTHYAPHLFLLHNQNLTCQQQHENKLKELIPVFKAEVPLAVKVIILAEATDQGGKVLYSESIERLKTTIKSLFDFPVDIAIQKYGGDGTNHYNECSLYLNPDYKETYYINKNIGENRYISKPSYEKQNLTVEVKLLQEKIAISKQIDDAFERYSKNPKFKNAKSFGFFHHHNIDSATKNKDYLLIQLLQSISPQETLNDFLENGPGNKHPSSFKTKLQEVLDESINRLKK